jgi:hypothetical protein
MVLEHNHEVVFQVAIGAVCALARYAAWALTHILRQAGFLGQINQLAFALSLQPVVRHCGWYGCDRVGAATKMVCSVKE